VRIWVDNQLRSQGTREDTGRIREFRIERERRQETQGTFFIYSVHVFLDTDSGLIFCSLLQLGSTTYTLWTVENALVLYIFAVAIAVAVTLASPRELACPQARVAGKRTFNTLMSSQVAASAAMPFHLMRP
jgi:hypothetical protein